MKEIKPPCDSSQWDEFFPKVEETIPEGFQTTYEIAAERGLTEATIRRQMQELMKQGKVDTIYGRKPGMKRPMQLYRSKNYGKQGNKKRS